MAANRSIQIAIGNRPYVCTEAEFEKARKALAAAWKRTLGALERQAAFLRASWDHHDALRKDTGFLIPAVIDAVSKGAFPPAGLISQAEQAVNDLGKAVDRADAKAIEAAYPVAHQRILRAATALDAYEAGIFEGGGKVVAVLEGVKAATRIGMGVTAAFATGGASVPVTAAVQASVGTFEALLEQIDKSFSDKDFDRPTAIRTVLLKGATEGLVSALFAKTTLAADLIEKASKALAAQSFRTIEKEVLRRIVEKMWKQGMESAAQAAVRDLIARASYDKSMTLEKIGRHGADEALKEVRLAVLLGLLDERLAGLAKAGSAYMKPEYFKGLGKIDYEKAVRKGGDKLITKAVEAAIAPILQKAATMKDLEAAPTDIAKMLGADPKLTKDLKALADKT